MEIDLRSSSSTRRGRFIKTKPSQKNSIDLIINGDSFIERNLEVINGATHFIMLHTYIFEDDEVTTPVVNALACAAERGVSVYVLLDAFGSQEFSDKARRSLIDSGVNCAYFTPIFHFYRLARRMHQKVLIADNTQCIIGGINLAKRFNSPTTESPWLDYSVFVQGEEVHNIYLKIVRHYLKYFSHKKDELQSFKAYSHQVSDQVVIKTIENDWGFRYREVTKSYYNAIDTAQDEIVILATYFLPGKRLLNLLQRAAKRGVKVTLIFSAMSDHAVVHACEEYFFKWYLKAGFEVFLWDQSMVHGKIALIDDNWTTVGSYNHNYLSKYGNCEINCEVINNAFRNTVKEELNRVISNSKKINIADINKTFRYSQYLSFFLLNFMTLFSLIFLYRQSDEDKESILR